MRSDSRKLEIARMIDYWSPTKIVEGVVVRTYSKTNRIKVRMSHSDTTTLCECPPGSNFAIGENVVVIRSTSLGRPFVIAYRGQSSTTGISGTGGYSDPAERVVSPVEPTNTRTYTSPVMAIFAWRPAAVETSHWYVVQQAKDDSGTDAETYLITQGSLFINIDPAYTHYRVAGAVLGGSGLERSTWTAWTAGEIDHAQGSIIRGEASDWAAYDASTDGYVLVGDGTDVVSRALLNSDLPDPYAFKTAPSVLTISGGSVTATQNLHTIAAESGTEDDLDTVSGLTGYQFLLIQADTGDTITVKHATGNIHFDSGLDFDLAGDSWLLLWYDGTNVVALGAGGRSDASVVTYTPAELTDWEGGLDPGDVDNALDQLASKVGNSSAGLLFSQVVDVEVTNTAVETSLLGAGRGSKTIPANDIDNGSIITYLLSGYGSTASEPSSLDITCKLGSSEICSTGMVLMTGPLTDFGFEIFGAITCRSTGAAGSAIGYGTFHYGDGNEHDMAKTSAVTIDTTAGLLFDVTAQWEAADADNEIVCQEAEIRLIKADSLAVAAPSGLVAAEV